MPASFNGWGKGFKVCLWMLCDGDQNDGPTSVTELLCD